MTTVNNVFDYLDSWAPVSTKESWDNAGILVGRGESAVNTILVALDITPKVIDEAMFIGAELIVSHHPVIFEPFSNVTENDIYGTRVLDLAENRMAAICMHTNLDKAFEGVDHALADALGFYRTEPLNESFGRISRHNTPIPLPDLLFHVKHSLSAPGLRFYDSGKPVKNIATVCGSGGSFIKECWEKGCDTLITGDLKYDHFIEAETFGLNIIDAGHFNTERVIVPVIVDKLSKRFPDLNVVESSFVIDQAQFYI